MFSTITLAPPRAKARRRLPALVAAAAVFLQPFALPAQALASRSRESRLAEGVERLSDSELSALWGGSEYVAPKPDARAGVAAHMGTGQTHWSEADIAIPIAGQRALSLTRIQSSRSFCAENDDEETMFGVSWWCEWDSRVRTSGTDMVWVAPWGEEVLFTNRESLGGGAYKWYSDVDQGVAATMESDPDTGFDSYEIVTKTKDVFTYRLGSTSHERGLLHSLEDAAGHGVETELDGSDRISKVKARASDGRYLEFTYASGTDFVEEIALKSTASALDDTLVEYEYGDASPYVPDANLRAVVFPNGYEKRYVYGSYEESGGSFTHETDADDNSEPTRTLCERSHYYYDAATSSWVEKPLYRAEWHEHTEGYLSGDSDAWLQREWLYDFVADDWQQAYQFDWLLEGDGSTTPWHAEGGAVYFDNPNVSDRDNYEADEKGDILSTGFWFDANPTTTPSYEVDRHAFRSLSAHRLPPGFPSGQDSTTAIETSVENGSDHDAYGNIQEQVDFYGRLTTFSALAANNMPSQRVDPAGNLTSWEYDAYRHLTKQTDALGRVSTYTYDGNGNLEGRVDFEGRRSTFTYYASAENYGYLNSFEMPDGSLSTMEYDARGNATFSETAGGMAVTSAYETGGPQGSLLAGVEDSLGNVSTREYDTRGLLVALVDPLGRRSTREYDPAGRPSGTVDPLGNRTTTVHDAWGRMVRFEDENGEATTYEYDAASRLERVEFEGGLSITYAYDGSACGCSSASAPPRLPTEMKTRGGDIFELAYDAFGRATSISYPGGSRLVTFSYATDPTDNPYGALFKVRDSNFSSGWDSNYHFEYKYDAWGRLLEERFPDGHAVAATYDADGRQETLSFDATAFVSTYAYDALSRLASVQNSAGKSMTWSYLASGAAKGLPEAIQISTGAATTFDYDGLRRLERLKIDPATGSDIARKLVYNDDGTVGRLYDSYTANPASHTGYLWEYGYDDARRLSFEKRRFQIGPTLLSPAFTQSYGYDDAGNRTSRTGSGTGYELFDDVASQTQYNARHELERYQQGSYTDIALTWNDDGQLTRKLDNDGSAAFDWSYEWSEDGRMTRAHDSVGGTDIRYVYDWSGRLLEREDETSSSNGPKRRFYPRGLAMAAERTAAYKSGAYTWKDSSLYTLGPGGNPTLLARRSGSADYFYHYDHAGNVLAETNASGAVVAQNWQDGFGRPVLDSAASGWNPLSRHQTGKQWDDDSGLFYFNERWYDASAGRFLSTAPLPRRQEHPYSFVENDPLAKVDPTGRTVDVCIANCWWSHWLIGQAPLVGWIIKGVGPRDPYVACQTACSRSFNAGPTTPPTPQDWFLPTGIWRRIRECAAGSGSLAADGSRCLDGSQCQADASAMIGEGNGSRSAWVIYYTVMKTNGGCFATWHVDVLPILPPPTPGAPPPLNPRT